MLEFHDVSNGNVMLYSAGVLHGLGQHQRCPLSDGQTLPDLEFYRPRHMRWDFDSKQCR